MAEDRKGAVLHQEISWDLRLVGCGVGAVIAAYPFLKAAEGSAFDAASFLWIAGGAGVMAIFIFMPSRTLFAEGATLTLVSRGIFGRKTEVIPAADVLSVRVGSIMTRYSDDGYHVAVKLKGRWGTFMGTDFANEDEAKTAQRNFLAAIGKTDSEGA